MALADIDEFLALPYGEPLFDRERAVRRLHADAREWMDRGHGMVAIRDRGSGRFLGRAALKYGAQTDETWFGVAIHEAERGRGFATEAGRALIGWGFGVVGIPDLSAMIESDNAVSIKLVERLGMTERRTIVTHRGSILVYCVTCAEWQAASW